MKDEMMNVNGKSFNLKQKALQYYYLYGTPSFCLGDIFWGVNIRIPFFEAVPVLKNSYYAISFSCGIFITRFPAKSELANMVESLSNFTILILSFWISLQGFIGSVIDGNDVAGNPFMFNVAIYMLMSGAVFLIAYYYNPLVAKMRLWDKFGKKYCEQ